MEEIKEVLQSTVVYIESKYIFNYVLFAQYIYYIVTKRDPLDYDRIYKTICTEEPKKRLMPYTTAPPI